MEALKTNLPTVLPQDLLQIGVYCVCGLVSTFSKPITLVTNAFYQTNNFGLAPNEDRLICPTVHLKVLSLVYTESTF
jgi:hypothetical protein